MNQTPKPALFLSFSISAQGEKESIRMILPLLSSSGFALIVLFLVVKKISRELQSNLLFLFPYFIPQDK